MKNTLLAPPIQPNPLPTLSRKKKNPLLTRSWVGNCELFFRGTYPLIRWVAL